MTTTEAAPAFHPYTTPQSRAETLVFNYVTSRLEKTDIHVTFGPDDVYIVWFAYTLGNWKALISTTLPDRMYYVDAYKNFENVYYS